MNNEELVQRLEKEEKLLRDAGFITTPDVMREAADAPRARLPAPDGEAAEPYKFAFPVMLRKMWSGGEVQQWLNDLPPLYAHPAPAPSVPAGWVPDADTLRTLEQLARRTLWIAYVWNDHNFSHPIEYARNEAVLYGINNKDDANKFLEKVAAMLPAAPTAASNEGEEA